MEFEVLDRNNFYRDGIVVAVVGDDLIATMAVGSSNRFGKGVVIVDFVAAFSLAVVVFFVRGGGRRRQVVLIEIVIDKAVRFLNAGVGLEIVIVARLGEREDYLNFCGRAAAYLGSGFCLLYISLLLALFYLFVQWLSGVTIGMLYGLWKRRCTARQMKDGCRHEREHGFVAARHL